MDKEREQKQEDLQKEETPREQPQRSGAFNEQSTKDQKSTHNIEEEAGIEEERKEATEGNRQ